MRIGITECYNEDKFPLYAAWIRSAAPEADLVTLSYEAGNAGRVDTLDAVVLTGGGDVHPKFYGEGRRLGRCTGVNERRDEFEFEVIDRVLNAGLPVLGVCRGMQIMNVFLGGTLYTDLAEDGFDDHASPKGAPEIRHPLSVVAHSTLQTVANGSFELQTNSFHHQAVRKLGNALVATAVSPDGVIEAAEWALKDGMPFLMLVQWHPERDTEHVVTTNLAALFIREVHHSVHQKTTT